MRILHFENWKAMLSHLALSGIDSPVKVASSAAVGVFFAVSPFWGFQLVLSVLVSSIFKLNRLIAACASNISIPPLIPFIIYASVELGVIITGKPVSFAALFNGGGLRRAVDMAPQYFLGAIILAFICAIVAWVLVYAFAAFLLRRIESGRENG